MKGLDIYLERPWLNNYVEGVPKEIMVPSVAVPRMIDETAEKYRDKVALIFLGSEVTYGKLIDYIKKMASAFRNLGIGKGDTLAINLPNCPQFIIAYHAALRIGAKVVSVSPLYRAKEMEFLLSDSEARSVITLDILSKEVAEAVRKTDVENIIVTNIADFISPIKSFLGKLLGKIPKAKAPAGALMFKDLLGRSKPLHETAEMDPKRDLAVLLYTGGTTGPPKGVMLSHYNLVANTMQLSEWIKPVAKEGEERVIALLPFFHVYGQVVYLILSLTLGFTLIVLPKFDIRNLLESIMKYKATMFIGVPYIYNVVATYEETNKYDLGSLKFCVCAADTLHQEIVDRWRRNVSVVEIYEGYGLTEMSPAVMVNPIGGKNKIGSMGIPIPSIDAAVVNPDTLEPMGVGEVGELITRGPNMMQGYWKKPEENRNVFIELDGEVWLRTGDMVKMDEEGYFYFIQRKKEMIKYKGYSVFPVEIEEALYEHPAIKEAAVIGLPDPRVGEKICAVVALKEEYIDKTSADDIISWCRSKLAHYKVPREVKIVDSLPKSAVGKILKRELRDKYMGG